MLRTVRRRSEKMEAVGVADVEEARGRGQENGQGQSE